MSFNRNKYKLLAIDLDGTMLNNGVLFPAVEEKLAEIAAKGVEIAIATGRSLPTVPICVRSLPFIRYAITSNGGNVHDYKNSDTISEVPMSLELALDVMQAIKSANASSYIIAMYPDTMVLPIRTYIRYLRSREFWRRLYSSKKSSKQMVKEALKSTMFVLSLTAAMKRRGTPVEKINLRFPSQRKFNKVSKVLEQFPVEAVTSMGLDLEINAKGVTKATGLQKLCEHLSIMPEQVIAAGDSYNDLEMLKFSGFSIVMGNAKEEIKQSADIVAPDVKEDGLAVALTELYG
jgi:Cof subfamily protein (haloacid dehalogenase superfamily)